MTHSYLVTWEINVEADSPEEAATQAHEIVRRPITTATVYTCENQETGALSEVDLGELDND